MSSTETHQPASQPAVPAGAYNLHGVLLFAGSPDAVIRGRLDAVLAPFATLFSGRPDIDLSLRFAEDEVLPESQPAGEIVLDERLLRCALDGDMLSACFPRWGLVTVDLAAGVIRGELLPAILTHYGAFDDMLIIVLGPLLRRRGFFSLHAFAASLDGQAALLVGDIGAGKTTTGLSLLDAGWQLVSNDSPLLGLAGDTVLAYAYPGLLAAYDDTLTHFPSLRPFAGPAGSPRVKRVFTADAAYGPAIWQQKAPVRLLLLPEIDPDLTKSRAEPLSQPEALLALLPHSIERWDRAYIPRHLAVLQALVRQTAAYRLLLAPDVPDLPALIGGLFR